MCGSCTFSLEYNLEEINSKMIYCRVDLSRSFTDTHQHSRKLKQEKILPQLERASKNLVKLDSLVVKCCLQTIENIALQSWQIFCSFVLSARNEYPRLSTGYYFPPVIQMHTRFAKFARLHFQYFTTFYSQTLQFY